jgi:hypothetical protein
MNAYAMATVMAPLAGKFDFIQSRILKSPLQTISEVVMPRYTAAMAGLDKFQRTADAALTGLKKIQSLPPIETAKKVCI